MVAQRAQVLVDMWENGVPVARLDNKSFRRLVEEPHDSIGGREGVRQQIPVAVLHLRENVKEKVKGRMVVVMFDGSKVNECVEAVIVRYLDDDDEIQHICIGAHMVSLNMNAVSLFTLVKKHLAEVGIDDAQIVFAVSDSAAVNPAMVDHWNNLIKELFGDDYDERRLFWMGCVSHGLSNAGTKMRKEALLVKTFFSGFKKMSNTSSSGRFLWKQLTGSSCPVLCDNRWWAWFDCASEVYEHWKKVPEFLHQMAQRGISEKSTIKMKSIADKKAKWLALELQIRACLVFGKPFRDACVLLEGDGFTLPFVSETLREIRQLMQAFELQRAQHPLFSDLLERLHDAGINEAQRYSFLDSHVLPVIEAGMKHFKESIWQKFSHHFGLFDAAAIFHPLVFLDKYGTAGFGELLLKHCKLFSDLKGVPRDASDFRFKLSAELESYAGQAKRFKDDWQEDEKNQTPKALWRFWKSQKVRLKSFFALAQILVLIVPSSAAVERFFSIVKAQTSPQQNAEYADTFTGRCMALYNPK